MFEIVAIIAVVLAIAVATVLILAAAKPDTFSVRRGAIMKTSPQRIFSLINDFHQWGTWSPWENKDPAMKRSFSGDTAEFTMLPQDDATSVNWVMYGPAPLMSKVMQVFMNIDKMVGKDFEAGLANLKRLTET